MHLFPHFVIGKVVQHLLFIEEAVVVILQERKSFRWLWLNAAVTQNFFFFCLWCSAATESLWGKSWFSAVNLVGYTSYTVLCRRPFVGWVGVEEEEEW